MTRLILKLKNVRSTKIRPRVRYLNVQESMSILARLHPHYPVLREDFRVGHDDFVME
jgi:hypothetical protein